MALDCACAYKYFQTIPLEYPFQSVYCFDRHDLLDLVRRKPATAFISIGDWRSRNHTNQANH